MPLEKKSWFSCLMIICFFNLVGIRHILVIFWTLPLFTGMPTLALRRAKSWPRSIVDKAQKNWTNNICKKKNIKIGRKIKIKQKFIDKTIDASSFGLVRFFNFCFPIIYRHSFFSYRGVFVLQGENLFLRDQPNLTKKLWWNILQQRFCIRGELTFRYATVFSKCKLNNRTPLLCFKITKAFVRTMLTFKWWVFVYKYFFVVKALSCKWNDAIEPIVKRLFAHLSLTMRLNLSESCFCLIKYNLKARKTHNWTMQAANELQKIL